MAITLEIFLYVYYILVGLFVIFALLNLYHIFRFGFTGFQGFFATFLFLAGAVLILHFSWQSISAINWQQPLGDFTNSLPKLF